jgi:NADH-quinone oxidoreductase subunit N
MMMGLVAFKPGVRAEEFEPIGLQAVLFYLVAYLFMNLGAFAVVAFLRNQTGSEELDSYRGLVRRSPWMVVTLSLFLLSLLGIPPLVGFMAKFRIFIALWDSYQAFYVKGDAGLAALEFGLLLVLGLNSVLSAVYNLKVMKVMILEERAEDLEGREPVRLPEPVQAVFFSAVVGLFVVVLGLSWNAMNKYSDEGAGRFAARTVSTPSKGMGGPKGGPPRGGPKGGGPKGGPRMGAPGKGKQGPRRPKGQ